MAAFFLSIAWVALGLFIGASYSAGDFRSLTAQGAHPTLFALAAGIVLPVLVFYVLAHMIRRAQELRIHRALDDRGRDAACRAGDDRRARSIVSVGQATAAKSPRWATASNARSRAPPTGSAGA